MPVPVTVASRRHCEDWLHGHSASVRDAGPLNRHEGFLVRPPLALFWHAKRIYPER